MKTIGQILLLAIFAISCGQDKNTTENSDNKPTKKPYEIKTDSIYSILADKYEAKSDWQVFDYEHLYELQDFLADSSKVLVIKYFNGFELYRNDSTFMCSYQIREFPNDIYLNLKIDNELVSGLRDFDYDNYHYFHLAVIRLDSVRPIDFEFNSEMDDYYSRVIMDRYMSLIGQGEVLDYKTITEKKKKASR